MVAVVVIMVVVLIELVIFCCRKFVSVLKIREFDIQLSEVCHMQTYSLQRAHSGGKTRGRQQCLQNVR